MGLFRSVVFGSFTWVFATSLMVHPEMALGLAIVVAFLSESTHHRGQLGRMQRQAGEVNTQLRAANQHIEELQRALTRRHVELNQAIEELQRRDAVGSPAARELLQRQEEAMNAASAALDVRDRRNDVVFESMERLLNAQVEQTSNMQQAMRDLLQHLITQPRANVTLTDSVMVSEEAHRHHQLDEPLRELNEWLRLQAAS